ncbi:MAG: hypothetical protein LIP77_11270 [Planctomycetes bacterium]|nr:hypothetical protein [Planctomycetota bacterium]
MPNPAVTMHLLLEKVPEDRQPDAALFLSGCFSLPPASTRGIAASGPIALLSDLGPDQAEAVLAEVRPSLPAGVELRLAGSGEAEKISRLQWPRPPRIYGRELKEFGRDVETHRLSCPDCGADFLVRRNAAGQLTAVREKKQESSRRLIPANDADPLFSGIKPLATDASNYASIRSLQAGDTGFWLDHGHHAAPGVPPTGELRDAAEGSESKKSTGKLAAGLSAFMKPGVFALVVGRTRDPQAVKMIAEIMGISQDEARDKCLNLGLCVARDIALDEAQNLLVRFKNLGLRARIVKPM